MISWIINSVLPTFVSSVIVVGLWMSLGWLLTRRRKK